MEHKCLLLRVGSVAGSTGRMNAITGGWGAGVCIAGLALTSSLRVPWEPQPTGTQARQIGREGSTPVSEEE